jgi:methyltransferase-like protein/SAM-dependent methyltransferase
MTDAASATSYDEVLYPNNAFAQTHPDRLATLGTLFGMTPKPIEKCRVLELGCGGGGNLIPMAFTLPESEFVGVDLAALPIAEGQRMIGALDLKNIKLDALDLMKISPDFGRFDYIICHGLYSWTPPPVRDHILAICHANLAPQGIAYISYNVYPGNHIRHMVREMMLFHTSQFTDPFERIDQAKSLVKFLLEAQTKETDAYSALLKGELERTSRQTRGAIYHDDLAEFNQPVYFHQFVRHAAAHDLQYLAEADFFEMQDQTYPAQIGEALRGLARKNVVLKEQYLDFIKCRRFRQTLICHAEVELTRTPKSECVSDFHIASSARPVSSQPDINSSAVEEFRGPKGSTVATDHPLAKATMTRLSELWPQTVSFGQLLTDVKFRLRLSEEASTHRQTATALLDFLINTYAVGLIEMHTRPFQFADKAGERPIASRLARMQAETNDRVVNLRHEGIRLEDDLVRRLLLLLDGTRDRAALITEIRHMAESGEFPLELDSADKSQTREEMLAEGLERSLESLTRLALLES